MKIILKQIVCYEVFTEDGISLGNFERVSTWEGMEKLASPRGTLIVQPKPSEFNKVFGQIFDGGHEVTVVSANPSLLIELKANPPERTQP